MEFERTGNDEADASAVRVQFLKRFAPDEYECYLKETHFIKGKQIFAMAFMKFSALANGQHLPDEAFVPSCQTPTRETQRTLSTIATAARTFFVQGMRQMLREAIRSPVPINIEAVSESLAGAVDKGRRDSPIHDDDFISARLEAGADLVGVFSGAAARDTFRMDPPMIQAAKLIQSASAATESRRWPNAFMLYFSDAAEGASEWFTLKQFYGDNHPDVVGWFKMSEPDRGEVTRRRFMELWQLAGRVANGQLPLRELATKVNGPVPDGIAEGRDFVEIVYGPATAERYARAASGSGHEPGYSADEILTGAYLLRVTLPQLALILQ